MSSKAKTCYKLFPSMEKAFNYTALISKEDMKVVVDGKECKLNNHIDKNKIIISDNYFRDYSCMDYPGCVICCNKVGFWSIFTEKQYKDLKKDNKDDIIDLSGEKKEILVNGNKIVVYVEEHMQRDCPHLRENGCDIHFNNPIHCMLPLIKFKNLKTKTGNKLHITKEVFGRNWQFGCPVTLKEFHFVSFEKFEERCIYPILKLKEFSEQLKVDTNIDYIISIIKKRYKELTTQGNLNNIY